MPRISMGGFGGRKPGTPKAQSCSRELSATGPVRTETGEAQQSLFPACSTGTLKSQLAILVHHSRRWYTLELHLWIKYNGFI